MIIQLESGQKLELPDGSSPADIDDAASHFMQTQAPAEKPSAMDNAFSKVFNAIAPEDQNAYKPQRDLTADLAAQAVQGATFGFGDEAIAATAAGMKAWDKKSINDLSKYYDEALNSERGFEGRFINDHPIMAVGAQLGGGLATGLAGAATKIGSTVGNSLRSGSIPARMAKGALAGAASGGLYGYGTGEGGTKERIQSGVDNAKLGAALGAAIPLATATAGHVLSREIVPNSDQLRQAGSNLYKQADQAGGVLTPQFTNEFVDEVQKLAPQTEIGKIVGGDSPFTQAVARISAIKDKPITLQAAQEFDELLGDAIDGFVDQGKLTKQGVKLLDVQSKFRNMIEEAKPEHFIGGKDGFDAVVQARKVWAASRRLADIERIVSRAEMMEQPATGIKSGFRTLYNNPSRMRGFTATERNAIKKAAESGIVSDIIRTAGSRLVPIVAGASGGGLGATAAATAGSIAARGLGARMQIGKANQVADIIARKGAAEAGIPVVRQSIFNKNQPQQVPFNPSLDLQKFYNNPP